MGYKGIPSQGCLPCRKRRIKCDEQRPICGKCARSRRTCEGWREKWDLVFRDEGLRLSQKQKASQQDSDPGASPDSTSAISSNSASSSPVRVQSQSLVARNSIPAALSIPLETIALNYFVSSFGSHPIPKKSTPAPGYLTTFEVLFPNQTPGSLLETTGVAVSLAALGARSKDQGIILKSQEKYATALSLARKEFSPPLSSPSNATILSVLLFSLYEQIRCPDNTLLGWSSHIKGALQLSKSHLRVDWNDEVTRKLMLAVRNQNAIEMMHSERFEFDPDMMRSLGQGGEAEDFRARPIVAYFGKIISLRTTLQQHATCGFLYLSDEECIRLMQETEALFTEIQGWRQPRQILQYYKFRVPISSTSTPPFSLLADRELWIVHPEIWANHVWNAYRVAQILVSSMCVVLGDHVRSRCLNFNAMYDSSMHYANIQQMSEDILGCVLCLLWPDRFRPSSQEFNEEDSRFGILHPESILRVDLEDPFDDRFDDPPISVPDPPTSVLPSPRYLHQLDSMTTPPDWSTIEPPKAGNALTLLWPLHLVGSARFAPERNRQYALEILKYISEEAGMRVASILGKPLSENILQNNIDAQGHKSGGLGSF